MACSWASRWEAGESGEVAGAMMMGEEGFWWWRGLG